MFRKDSLLFFLVVFLIIFILLFFALVLILQFRLSQKETSNRVKQPTLNFLFGSFDFLFILLYWGSILLLFVRCWRFLDQWLVFGDDHLAGELVFGGVWLLLFLVFWGKCALIEAHVGVLVAGCLGRHRIVSLYGWTLEACILLSFVPERLYLVLILINYIFLLQLHLGEFLLIFINQFFVWGFYCII